MFSFHNFWDDLFPGPRPERIRLLSWIRYAMREFARRIVYFFVRRKVSQRASIAAKRDHVGSIPAVTYVGMVDSHPSLVIGGAVKLLALKDRLPETSHGFNLIYLVSSALPPHVEQFIVAAKKQGARFVWNQNGVAYPAWCGDFYPWFNTPIRRLYQLADYIIYQSEFCRACAERYLGSTPSHGEILWNPVDTDAFYPSEEVRQPGEWRLLAAGTNHHFYRVKSVLDCLRLLREMGHFAHLTIAGEFRWSGGDKQVQHYIKELELAECVTLKPPFLRDQAPQIYQHADILLHSKYKDPCPTVPIEALSSGVPVVGSHSGGMPELVPLDCGVLVDVPDHWDIDIAPDPAAMAQGVVKIMANYDQYAMAARQHALRAFDQRRWLERHEEIFHQIFNS